MLSIGLPWSSLGRVGSHSVISKCARLDRGHAGSIIIIQREVGVLLNSVWCFFRKPPTASGDFANSP